MFTRKKFQSSFLRNANYFVFNQYGVSTREWKNMCSLVMFLGARSRHKFNVFLCSLVSSENLFIATFYKLLLFFTRPFYLCIRCLPKINSWGWDNYWSFQGRKSLIIPAAFLHFVYTIWKHFLFFWRFFIKKQILLIIPSLRFYLKIRNSLSLNT